MRAASLLPIFALGIAFGTIAAAGFAAGEAPWNWGTEHSDLTSSDEFAESKAICRKLGEVVIPAADQPTAADRQRLKGCDAEKLYYGIGVKQDLVAARQCALIDWDGRGADHAPAGFSSAYILAQAYANGEGGPASQANATRIACADQAAPMENDGRVLHLQKLKPGEHFAWCDDITSGLMEGVCAAHEATIGDQKRGGALTATVARLPARARALYPALKAAEAKFASAQGDGETDLTGSGRAAFEIEAEDANHKQFLTDLRRLAAGKWPAASHADAANADRQLNAQYASALAWVGGKGYLTTVKPEDIRKAQRAWLPYRDAWVRLGVAAGVPADAILARITRLRLAQLSQFPAD